MKRILYIFLLFIGNLFFAQSDCDTAIPVCGTAISYLPSGHGSEMEQIGGCASSEHYSVWYKFTIATTGTLTFEISPNAPFTADYDFAVFGPNVTCANKGTPIRCNYDGANPAPNQTGLQVGQTDPNGGGGPWSSPLDVVAGETYYLVVDNWSGANAVMGFTLTWGGSAALASAFNDPVLTPNPFITPGQPSATPNSPNEILKCALPTNFDFTTLSAGILNGNANYNITYHNANNDALTGQNPLTTTSVNGTTTYYYRLNYQDPNDPNNPLNECFQVGMFKFRKGDITPTNVTLTECNIDNQGTGIFNLNSANVYPTDPTVTKKFYLTMADLNANTNEITNSANYVSAPKTVFVKLITAEGCSGVASINLTFTPPFATQNTSIRSCNNNGEGTAKFNLTIPNPLPGDPNITKRYFPTLADLNAGTNEILNPTAYVSTEKIVYVLVRKQNGCVNYATITLQFFPVVTTMDDTLETCSLDDEHNIGIFNLSTAITTNQVSVVKKYYRTINDANTETNEISTPLEFKTPSTTIYCRINNENNCYSIAKITLIVKAPVLSTTLKDKEICIENLTTLDAGPNFASYLWSNGATTQSITNVGVGTYLVKLQLGTCVTTNYVNVKPVELPVIKSVDISFEKISVKNVVGGNPPYQYSIDGVNYQDSPEFTPIPRGETTVYVKDNSNCIPVTTTVTVPNIANAITPNGDNINDYIDYSALANKKNLAFTVYDRYGNQVFKGEKFNNYKWDGRMQDKRIQTGTYWYTLTWNENDTNNTPIIYNGWVLVKNKN